MPTRECKGCDICCFAPAISEIGKPPNTKCSRASDCGGCALYEIRPKVCRELSCAWLSGAFGTVEDWPQYEGLAVIDRGKYHEDLEHRYAIVIQDRRRFVSESKRQALVHRLHAAGWAIVFIDSPLEEQLPEVFVNQHAPGIGPIMWSLEEGDLIVTRV